MKVFTQVFQFCAVRTCIVFALLPVVLGSSVRGEVPEDYDRQVEAERAARLQRLTGSDGWLTLIGLHWLAPGANSIGTSRDNRITTAAGPAHFGTVELAPDGKVQFTPAPDVAIEIDGNAAQAGDPVELRDDQSEDARPTRVRAGNVSFHLIDRSGKKGLRVRDADAASRLYFQGLDNYSTDAAWRVEADWVPFDAPRTESVVNILGDVEPERVVGEAVFTREGHVVHLLPVWDGNPEERLFFIISDETSGSETYGAARFVYADPPRNGKVTIDFNLALNPPCAFTPFATCPLPPRQNRLPFPVRAGEKRYRGEAGH